MEFDREADAPAILSGIKIARIGAAARVLEEQTPVFLPDVSQEMLKHPELAPFAPQSVSRNTYVFPVSTSQERYGILVVTRERGEEFVPEDVELLRSLASHVAVALECAVARDSAEQYQRDLAKERDRLRLLLEINNHVVSQLDIKDVFRAASVSIRSYFANEFTGVWLIDRGANQLQSVLLDFPTGRGLLDDVAPTQLTDDDFDRLRRREPGFWSVADIERLPAPIAEKLRAELIQSVTVTPLVTGTGPLGLLAIGSRRPDAFGQQDLDLFCQIGAQIALAVDNAMAYGRLSASHAHLEDQRVYLESGNQRRIQLRGHRGQKCRTARGARPRLNRRADRLDCAAARRDRYGQGADPGPRSLLPDGAVDKCEDTLRRML